MNKLKTMLKFTKKLIFLIIFIVSLVLIFLIVPFFLNKFDQLPRIEFNINGFIIDDFAYWLQDTNKETIRNSKYDLIIIDYSSDGSESGEYTSTDVIYMKSSGINEKLLLSYISIGEAEDYRFYWNESWDENHDGLPDMGSPDWLDIENPDWEGNYKVKFWMEEWQHIIYNYLDRILTGGFDGIYMDIIDAYEYYQSVIIHSDWKMIDFVSNISNYVKSHSSANFSVFVQNADELLLNSTYLDHIDGIGREDLFYFDNTPTSISWRNEGINNLNHALNLNKTVLITDYPQLKTSKYKFYENCIYNGYLGYAANRELDKLEETNFYAST
jgi:cysteinyl-tRNA synthetase